MDENLLEIRDYNGKGYQPLVDFGGWRVAILCHLDELKPDHINSMERHIETDEVFVLIQGIGILFLGGNQPAVNEIHPQAMEIGKLYNVKRKAWHTVALSQDAKVLLVENCDTGEQNSEHTSLLPEHSQTIRDFANRQLNGKLP